MAELCEAYWHPVYAFIRRKGNDPDRAADLTQSFFTVLIETEALTRRHTGEREISLVPDGRLQSLSLQPESSRARTEAWRRTFPRLDRPTQGRGPTES